MWFCKHFSWNLYLFTSIFHGELHLFQKIGNMEKYTKDRVILIIEMIMFQNPETTFIWENQDKQ